MDGENLENIKGESEAEVGIQLALDVLFVSDDAGKDGDHHERRARTEMPFRNSLSVSLNDDRVGEEAVVDLHHGDELRQGEEYHADKLQPVPVNEGARNQTGRTSETSCSSVLNRRLMRSTPRIFRDTLRCSDE